MSAVLTRLLPNKAIVKNILAYLTLHDLTSASLVSRSWQSLAFPFLYHTVFLTFTRDLQLLAERSASDSNDLPSQIRGLELDDDYRKTKGHKDGIIEEKDLGHLITLIPKLTQLERLNWDLAFVPRNPDVLHVFQTECPNLRSLHWSIVEDDSFEFDSDDYYRLFKFKNLLHFSLTIEYLPGSGFYEENTEPIASLIHASPNIQSLTLNFKDWDDMGITWSPGTFVGALEDLTLPSLNTFRALGSTDPDWWGFFDSPQSHPLCNFFKRHPQIHTVGLGWAYQPAYYLPIDPETLAMHFPSLKNFEGSAFMCGPLLASSLAKQLESLVVLDEVYFGVGPDLSMMTQTMNPLPKLRKLIFHMWKINLTEVEPLKALLSVAPMVDELEFRATLDEPDQLLEVLKLAPNLRRLGIPLEVLDPTKEEIDQSEVPGCINPLLQACPFLMCVKNVNARRDEAAFWVISRDVDGQATMTQSNSC